ncbi:MAG: hypothetical protein OEM32_08915, partial [Acidimicrobiia bacterium]|nr:hypothetical protein [Acidimicrobiia bacterium]
MPDCQGSDNQLILRYLHANIVVANAASPAPLQSSRDPESTVSAVMGGGAEVRGDAWTGSGKSVGVRSSRYVNVEVGPDDAGVGTASATVVVGWFVLDAVT